MFVIFDLDGTLSLTEHRYRFLTGVTKDWRGFYAACDGDAPHGPIIETMRAMVAVGYRVEIWSGRSDEVSDKTKAWFAKYGVPPVSRVLMRKEGDHTPDDILKLRWLDECDAKPDLVFEDRARMVRMFRDQGIVCCQVAPGDF